MRPRSIPARLAPGGPLFMPAYLAAYLLLDWVSFDFAFNNLNITPWNLPLGLNFFLFLRHGLRYVPLAVVARLVGNLLIHDQDFTATMVLGVLLGAYGYALSAQVLRRWLPPDLTPQVSRGVTILLLGAAAAAVAVTIAYVGMLAGFGLVAPEDFAEASLRRWVGDAIGITVITIFLQAVTQRVDRRLAWPELAIQALAILGAAVLVFSRAGQEFQLFYLIFLPLVWMAVRGGLLAASAGVVATQTVLIAVLRAFTNHTDTTVTAMQVLMLVLAMSTLLLGAVVSDRRQAESRQRRAEEQLARKQNQMAQLERISVLGQMTTTIAHEINQPLSAIVNYTRACRLLMAAPDHGGERLAATMDKAIEQAERTSEIIRRMREFIGKGWSEIGRHPVAPLVDGAISLVRDEAERHRVAISAQCQPGLPAAAVDDVQFQQVLVNLLRNAIDALAAQEARRILVHAGLDADGMVRVSVHDNGPGVDAEIATQLFKPFISSKMTGLGLGLSICRSIVEGWGGRLWNEAPAGGGALFLFTAPPAPSP